MLGFIMKYLEVQGVGIYDELSRGTGCWDLLRSI